MTVQTTRQLLLRSKLVPALAVAHTSAYVSIRQHTSAYVSIRQHTSALVAALGVAQRGPQETCRTRQHTPAYVSIRQHTSAYLLGVVQRAQQERCRA